MNKKEEYRKQIWKFKDYFVKRMTIDSKHNDARKKDFNQSLFSKDFRGNYTQCWSEIDLDMIMVCFENALKDYLQELNHKGEKYE